MELPDAVRPRSARRRTAGRAHGRAGRGTRRSCVFERDRRRRRGGARGAQRHAGAHRRRARGRHARRAVRRLPRRRSASSGSRTRGERPLDGLRVLDLTRFVAGSQTTALLAALGADVIKLEVPPGGDPYRVQGTERLGDESVLFLSLNSGKRSVALDFRSPSAADAIDRLLGIVRLPGGERAAREPGAVRPGLGAGARALSLDRLRVDLGVRRRRSARGARRVRPDPAGRERRHERDGERGLGTREGRRAGAGRRRRDQLCVRAPGRAPRTAAHGRRDATCPRR